MYSVKKILLVGAVSLSLQGCSLLSGLMGLGLTSMSSSGETAYVVAASHSEGNLYGVFAGERPVVQSAAVNSHAESDVQSYEEDDNGVIIAR